MLLRAKGYEAPQSPGLTFDLAHQLSSHDKTVLPDQAEQSTVLPHQINHLYTGMTYLDGTPTEEGEA